MLQNFLRKTSQFASASEAPVDSSNIGSSTTVRSSFMGSVRRMSSALSVTTAAAGGRDRSGSGASQHSAASSIAEDTDMDEAREDEVTHVRHFESC